MNNKIWIVMIINFVFLFGTHCAITELPEEPVTQNNDNSQNTIDSSDLKAVQLASDLPACNATVDGTMYYIIVTDTFTYCLNGTYTDVATQNIPVVASCGDGSLDYIHGEHCDDGNNTGGDGCNSICRFEPPANAMVHYNSPGLDGAWYTLDDVIDGYQVHQYDANNRLIRKEWWAEKEPNDGAWFSGDDYLEWYDSYTYDGAGNLIQRTSFDTYMELFGYDGIPFTSDDPVYNAEEREYNASNQVTRSVQGSWGADNLFFTSDDRPDVYTENFYDASGNHISTAQYSTWDFGLDGNLYTADDPIEQCSLFTLNASGQQTRVEYASPGADATCGTGDDNMLQSYGDFTYDAQGNRTSETYYLDYGNDGTPFNGDDTLSRQKVFQFDASGNMTAEAHADSEGIWYRIRTYTYDANGKVVRRIRYLGFGADGIKFNEDDVMGSYSQSY